MVKRIHFIWYEDESIRIPRTLYLALEFHIHTVYKILVKNEDKLQFLVVLYYEFKVWFHRIWFKLIYSVQLMVRALGLKWQAEIQNSKQIYDLISATNKITNGC